MHWYGELQCFDFEIKYQTGKSNTKANTLSRRPDYGDTAEEDAPVQVFPSEATIHTSFTSELETLLQKTSVEYIMKPSDLDDSWTWDWSGLWWRGNMVWIPPAVQESMLDHEHNIPTAGHPGIKKMKSAVFRTYWWPKVEKGVQSYMVGCETCQRTKCSAPLHPHPVLPGPWAVISWDIVGPLPQSCGFDPILVIIDKFTKHTLIKVIGFNLTSLGAAWILRD